MFKEWNKIDSAALGLIVIILLVVFWTALNSARAKARDVKRVRDVQYIQEALKLYFNDNLDYPRVSGIGQAAVPDDSDCTQSKTEFECYMPNYPGYPLPADGAACLNYQGYAYSKLPASEGGYGITFCLGQETGGFSAGPHRATANGIN